MEITEVRISLHEEDKLKAYASITFDNCFVVRGLKVINGTQGYFISMPSRRRRDGSFQDIAHPVTNIMRLHIEEKVLDAFEQELNRTGGGKVVASGPQEAEFEPGEESVQS